MQDGKFEIETMMLESGGPFRAAIGCDWPLAQILCQCDGVKTGSELFEWARGEGLLPAAVTAEEFAGMLGKLVRRGLLE